MRVMELQPNFVYGTKGDRLYFTFESKEPSQPILDTPEPQNSDWRDQILDRVSFAFWRM